METKKKKPAHALFWSLLRETEGYNEAYKEVMKEGIVHRYSGGRTMSLSEMYRLYPAEYSRMIDAMKGDSLQRQARYEASRERSRYYLDVAYRKLWFRLCYPEGKIVRRRCATSSPLPAAQPTVGTSMRYLSRS